MRTSASTYASSEQSQLQARVRSRSGLMVRMPVSMLETFARSSPSSPAAWSAVMPAAVRIFRSSAPNRL